MLASLALSSSAYIMPSLTPSPCRATVVATSDAARITAPMMADDLSMIEAMSDSFWKQKRARLQAEMQQQLLELEEFEAREKALQQVAASSGPALSAGAGVAELQAMLEAERARSAQLEEMLAKQAIEAEVNLQKVSAYWINKVAEAKGALPAAAAAPAIAGAPAAAKPVAADLVTGVPKEYLEPELSLKELRARLLAKGLSTLGLKSELRERLEQNMLLDRQQFKSWDSEALAWK